MHENAGRAQLCDDAMGEIAGAFRGAAGEHDHVALGERIAHRALKRRFTIRESTESDRLAAGFRDCRRDNRAIAVVDSRRRERGARWGQLIPSRKHRHLRLAHHRNLRIATGRENADLPRGDARPPAQYRLATGDVGAGIGNELSGRRGAAHVDCGRAILLLRLGMLDHHHGIGAARNDAAGCDCGCGARHDLERGRMAADDDLAVETKAPRRAVARAGGFGGAQCTAIDIGAIERRHVDGRRDIGCERATERESKGDGFARQRRKLDVASEARARLLGRHDFQELLLPHRAPDRS